MVSLALHTVAPQTVASAISIPGQTAAIWTTLKSKQQPRCSWRSYPLECATRVLFAPVFYSPFNTLNFSLIILWLLLCVVLCIFSFVDNDWSDSFNPYSLPSATCLFSLTLPIRTTPCTAVIVSHIFPSQVYLLTPATTRNCCSYSCTPLPGPTFSTHSSSPCTYFRCITIDSIKVCRHRIVCEFFLFAFVFCSRHDSQYRVPDVRMFFCS